MTLTTSKTLMAMRRNKVSIAATAVAAALLVPRAAMGHNSVGINLNILIGLLAYIILLPVLIIANMVKFVNNISAKNPNKAAIVIILSTLALAGCFVPAFIYYDWGGAFNQLSLALFTIGLLHIVIIWSSARIISSHRKNGDNAGTHQ